MYASPRAVTIVLVGTVAMLVPMRLTPATANPPLPVAPNGTHAAHAIDWPKIPVGNHRLVGQGHDDDGKAVGDVVVEAVALQPGEKIPLVYKSGTIRPTRFVHSDATGKFTLTDLPDGHFGITVRDGAIFSKDPGYHSRRSATGRFATNIAETTIGPDEKAKTFNPAVSRGVTLTGRVLDRISSRPLPNLTVVGSLEQNKDGKLVGSDGCRTGADGSYFLRLPPGRVSAHVLMRGSLLSGSFSKVFPLSIGQNATCDLRVTLPAATPTFPSNVSHFPSTHGP